MGMRGGGTQHMKTGLEMVSDKPWASLEEVPNRRCQSLLAVEATQGSEGPMCRQPLTYGRQTCQPAEYPWSLAQTCPR